MLAKKDKFLYGSVILLSLLLILSYVKNSFSGDKRETVKSSLVNPKYLTAINQIELYNISSSTSLKKIQNKDSSYWAIFDKDNKLISPADSQKVEKLLSELTKIRTMYKLSDKVDINSAFGLTDSSAFHIRYYYDDGFHDLTFGNQDFSLSGRYLITDKNTRVYEINSDLDLYLSSSLQSWTEPYIISREILGPISSRDIQSCKTLYQNRISKIDDLEKLLELRKGGTVENFKEAEENLDYEISLEIGNKSQIIINIYKSTNESEFLVKGTYINPDKNSLSYYSKISLWTYNKIKEITL